MLTFQCVACLHTSGLSVFPLYRCLFPSAFICPSASMSSSLPSLFTSLCKLTGPGKVILHSLVSSSRHHYEERSSLLFSELKYKATSKPGLIPLSSQPEVSTAASLALQSSLGSFPSRGHILVALSNL